MSELKPCPQEHELKCWPEYYDAIVRGDKPFEIRRWDRPYKEGDTLLLRRYDPQAQTYTGEQTRQKITYLLDLTYLPGDDRPHFAGYVALGLTAQPANEPLTLAQMREMDGAPVWMNQKKQWVFIASTSESPYAQVWYFRKGFMYTVLYHHEKFYRHKPERSEG